MTALLKVENLEYTQKPTRSLFKKRSGFTLSKVSFELNSGETLAILGENGSGKSLLGKLLVGAEIPTGGNIFLNGQKLSPHNLRQRCLNIRMIFQHSNESLNPGINIAKILEGPLILNTQLSSTERLKKIEQTLKLVGLLPDHMFFYRHMLSDGQRQRLALAKALILDPQVIVADEPFAALDPSVRSQTINLIMKLQKDLGLGFIFISHNLGIIRHISDRVLILQNGNLVETGKTDVVFNWPKSEYTEKLVKSHLSLITPN
ncbi:MULTISPECIES: ATP-binding cassette domain-containing protein [Alteromonadaceae]|uniref:ATP-binding cassette domain-containing protein n=1 Tax=Alteromonadaceae TaxID=72275 RepID=UPI001C0A0081|nr:MULTISPECIES: ATP-binding cassette domain-containing protein [Aliiglaciecola]MBU2879836.1 ATP-binding cassette domain-containing protein [Aliiglaciecola lipolytica]MDO6709885.1 ATP-binding cassette domain-containing protein [Aliiglaciecola sp. 2_MG-2023]MDO6751033.1 ATP-binding cassette domain-containing protein [Aliiglaciecola sp. 1_MG-2023]